MTDREVLLRATDVVQEFRVPGRGRARVQALSGVSVTVHRGETVGVVGETGSGKSTLARALIGDPPPQSGTVEFDGRELTGLRGRALTRARSRMQMVYQDPFGSLNPRWRVADIVAEPLHGFGVGDAASRAARATELLDLVGLDPDRYARRRPYELSGGQCQRVAIARAIALDPALVVCDEAVSSLDVLVRAQVLALFARLRAELGLAYVFIGHDLGVVRQVSDRVAVLHLGELVELGGVDELYRSPRHPYTAALLASIPEVDRRTGVARRPSSLPGEPPSPLDPPSGCRFRTRCPYAVDRCATERPRPVTIGPGHEVACHFPLPLRRAVATSGAEARSGDASMGVKGDHASSVVKVR